MSNLNSDKCVRFGNHHSFVSTIKKMLSKASQHGIKAMICITRNSIKGERISIGDVASKIKTPVAYTSKIIQRLVKAGMVQSKKGASGGFYIEKSLVNKVSVWDVVNELDGGAIKYGCILGLDECSGRKPCPAHKEYKPVRDQLIRFLQNTSLAKLADKVSKGEGTLVMNLNSI